MLAVCHQNSFPTLNCDEGSALDLGQMEANRSKGRVATIIKVSSKVVTRPNYQTQ